VAVVNESQKHLVAVLVSALEEAREFIDGKIDVVDGSYGRPEPNKAMRLATEIDAALALARIIGS
jgi:hypothetical protein